MAQTYNLNRGKEAVREPDYFNPYARKAKSAGPICDPAAFERAINARLGQHG